MDHARIPEAKDKTLFTPGPLTTSRTVKQAMLRDLGSRDIEFIALVARVRARLLQVAGTSKERGYEAIPIQGSGTFGVESVISSAIARDGGLLVIVNGAYGERIVQMAAVHGIRTAVLRTAENAPPDLAAIERTLAADPGLTHVAVVHSETTAGIVNDVESVGRLAAAARRTLVVDAMSSFGAIPLDLERARVAFVVSSANKCIEGVPGFSFVVARRDELERCAGRARTLSLDLHAQWRGLEEGGQFRFTPPTHALLAFDQALAELEAEGGVAGRGARYSRNHAALVAGMRALGFEPYVDAAYQGPIITTFRYPDDPAFSFARFYERLNERGLVIYPGKLTRADCFRIGTIGRIFEQDVHALVLAVREALVELGVAIPVRA